MMKLPGAHHETMSMRLHEKNDRNRGLRLKLDLTNDSKKFSACISEPSTKHKHILCEKRDNPIDWKTLGRSENL